VKVGDKEESTELTMTRLISTFWISPSSISFSYTLPYIQHNKMSAVAGPSTKPVIPFYCEVCTLPTEYCEFGPSVTKCKTWLESEDKGEFDRLWGEGLLLDYYQVMWADM
jgi:hypothetical protein